MAIADETLKAIIRDYHGFELSDAELALIRPELENYMAELEKLRDMDLSGATTPEQVSANAKAIDWHLTAKEMEELESTLMATG